MVCLKFVMETTPFGAECNVGDHLSSLRSSKPQPSNISWALWSGNCSSES